MPDRADVIDAVAAAVADDECVDWTRAAGADLPAAELDLLQQLRVISAIGNARRSAIVQAAERFPRPLVAGYAVVVALTGLKFAFGAVGALTSISWTDVNAPVWPMALTLLLFGVTGTLLVVGSAKDRRVRSLGALLVMIATAFADPVLARTADGVFGAGASALRYTPTEAFLPLLLWLFVRGFPSLGQRRTVRVADGFLAASAVSGAGLFAANVALAWEGLRTGSSVGAAVVRSFDRHAPTGVYWQVLFGITLPAMPYLVWKARFETAESRRRVALFVFALAASLTPMLVAVIVSPLIPSLADPLRRRWVGFALYASLLSLIPSTLYAVAVRRVMDIQFFIHKAMRHALARTSVWVASVGPIAYLIVDVYRNRALTVTDLFSSGESVALLVCSVLGFNVLTFRHELLRLVDRWFARDTTDHAQALARLELGMRSAHSLEETARLVAREIDTALHPTVVGVLIVNEDTGMLAVMAGPVGALSSDSALVDLLRSAQTDIQLNSLDGPIGRLLPPADRDWLVDSGVHALFPLIGSTGTLLGLIALGERRSGLPYTAQDRVLLTALSGDVSMRLENRRLQQRPSDRRDPLNGEAPWVDWQNEPGVYCRHCFTVWGPDRRTCSCGSETIAAALPCFVQGKFQVERFIGSGGMGVVYLAVDLTLDRKVAIKTLPTMRPEHSTRLQREARAMASVLHPNLALIFGAEYWRGTPLLIVEYLEGGTLSDRLRRGPLSVEEVIDLGVVLSDVLDRIHASGVLHRDIKPSNIGYTRDGFPKLLDFGLAAILDRSKDAEPSPAALIESTFVPELLEGLQPSATITITQQIVGTPLYLAPEALTGIRAEARFDLWSLSLVLYEALAGQHPLGSDVSVPDVLAKLRHVSIADIRTFRPDCPADVAALFQEALARAPERRPATAGELRNRLHLLRSSLNAPRF